MLTPQGSVLPRAAASRIYWGCGARPGEANMVRIEHIAEVLERYDNWTDRDETAICKLLEVDHHKAGVSQRAVSKLINGMYPGHQHIPFLGQVITFIFLN